MDCPVTQNSAHPPIAATSPDGVTWTQRTLPASADWYSVTYGNGVFVAVAQGSSIAATSPDGITWTQRTLPVSADWIVVTYPRMTFHHRACPSRLGQPLCQVAQPFRSLVARASCRAKFLAQLT